MVLGKIATFLLYLHYHQHLGGADHDEGIKEHERFERRPLNQFFNQTFDEAMRCRLMANMKVASSTSEENSS